MRPKLTATVVNAGTYTKDWIEDRPAGVPQTKGGWIQLIEWQDRDPVTKGVLARRRSVTINTTRERAVQAIHALARFDDVV